MALSYHDVYLEEADIQLLHGPHWLNDQVISFAFEYLEQEIMLPGRTMAIPGAATALLRFGSPADAAAMLKHMKAGAAAGLLLAVNDSTSPDIPNSGSHWSLLAVSLEKDEASGTAVAWHLDSAGSANTAAARVVTKRLAQALEIPIKIQKVLAAPQQHNGHDCGVHVLAAAEALWHVPPREWPANTKLSSLPPASSTRQRWANTVQRLLEPA